LDGLQVEYATTDAGRIADVPGGRLHLFTDANQRTPLRMIACAWQVASLLLEVRPRIVISTGAAPGLFAVVFGRLLGARTVWIEPCSHVNRLTLSGRMVRRFADLYLVQWPHLARPNGPHYRGSVL
jgi:UDP-N-acetylglucosamine:LPS N-acetylglucosamine transferase